MTEDCISTVCHGRVGESETVANRIEERQTYSALDTTHYLSTNLMPEICSWNNLRKAYKQVRSNKGAAGSDGITVAQMHDYFKANIQAIRELLLGGDYHPQPVLSVKIPKPGGGERQLGIPTIADRVIQQAILQVLQKGYDSSFSTSSYGFRPNKSAHDALRAASQYVDEGYVWVVDLDLEQFFDRVNHDILMSKLAKRISDKILLKLIRRYLETGIMQDGRIERRQKGTPQGSPLSPFLSNIMLSDLDKELEKRGHKFCRYADDCNIYVKSERAGRRVMQSVSQFLENRLRLKVNTDKSAVALVEQRKFLGYQLQTDGRLLIAEQSLKRLKDKIRQKTKRNRGRSLESVIQEVNQILRGWFHYFKLTYSFRTLLGLDGWIRRKLRCYRLKQKKRYWGRVTWLKSLGLGEIQARRISCSSKGWWRIALSPPLHQALNTEWFRSQGLFSLGDSWFKWVKA